MRMETRHGSAGRQGTPLWRLLVAVVLVAVGMVLLAPGTATAHVKAKYRAEYKRNLTGWQKAFDQFAHTYDETELQSSSLAATLAPMIGDPSHREDLVAGENYALQVYNAAKDKPRLLMSAITKRLDAFKAKASRFFVAKSDRRRFRQHVGRVWGEFKILLQMALTHVYLSYEALSHDPPALDLSAQQLADGDADAALAHEEFEKDMAGLKKLQ